MCVCLHIMQIKQEGGSALGPARAEYKKRNGRYTTMTHLSSVLVVGRSGVAKNLKGCEAVRMLVHLKPKWIRTYSFKLIFRSIFEFTNVLHCHSVPFISPTKELPMEYREDTLLLLLIRNAELWISVRRVVANLVMKISHHCLGTMPIFMIKVSVHSARL